MFAGENRNKLSHSHKWLSHSLTLTLECVGVFYGRTSPMQICWASKVLQLLLEGRGKSEDEGSSALGPVPHRTRVNWLSTPEGRQGRRRVSVKLLWGGTAWRELAEAENKHSAVRVLHRHQSPSGCLEKKQTNETDPEENLRGRHSCGRQCFVGEPVMMRWADCCIFVVIGSSLTT